MHPFLPARTAPGRLALCLAAALAAGCDSDTARLVDEIDDARQGCTQDSLRAGSEECIQMFQRYAEMGTEAMQSYIGAVQAMGEALDRMPPAQFDTAGLGHAISPGALAPPAGTATAAPLPRTARLPVEQERAPAPQPGLRGGGRWEDNGWGAAEPYTPDGRWSDAPYGRDALPGTGWGYGERGGWGGGYDPRGGYEGYGRSDDYRGFGGYDYGYDEYREYGGYDGVSRARSRRYPAEPPRGGLRPPEERLQRPWLRDRGDARYDTRERWRILPQRRGPRADLDTLQPGASLRRARP